MDDTVTPKPCGMCGGAKRIPVTTVVGAPNAGWADCPQCAKVTTSLQSSPATVELLREKPLTEQERTECNEALHNLAHLAKPAPNEAESDVVEAALQTLNDAHFNPGLLHKAGDPDDVVENAVRILRAALASSRDDVVEAFLKKRLAALSLLARDKDHPDHQMRSYALGAVTAVCSDLLRALKDRSNG